MPPRKKVGPDPSAVMAKALKKEHETLFNGEPVILTPLYYTDDILLSAMMNDLSVKAEQYEISDTNLIAARTMMGMTGLLHMTTFVRNEDGSKSKRFSTMEEASSHARTKEGFEEMQKLFNEHREVFVLTKQEKKV